MPNVQNRFFLRVILAAGLVIAGIPGYAEILSTTAIAKPDNSLSVDIQVTTAGSAAKLAVTYQTPGVEPLISRLTPVSTARHDGHHRREAESQPAVHIHRARHRRLRRAGGHGQGELQTAPLPATLVGAAQRLENGNTLILFGTDVDPTTLSARNPQSFTLVEADATPAASAWRSEHADSGAHYLSSRAREDSVRRGPVEKAQLM